MGITWQQGGIFAAGAAAGAVAGALLVAGLRPGGPAEEAASPGTPVQASAAAHIAAPCPSQPMLPAGSERDGKFRLPHEVAGYGVPDVRSFIAIGQEAAAGGRPRDAEVAFMTACRVADRFAGAGSIDAADARQQLAAHYDARARGPGDAAAREALFQRAEALYSDSVQIHAAAFGMYHEKTERSSSGLLRVREALGPAGSAARMGAAPAASAPMQDPALPGRAADAAAAPALRAAPARPSAGAPPKPSFDCARAHSSTEKLICSDARLAALDRDLGRLHARAQAVTRHPAQFKRDNDREWRRREARCRDRSCLLRWYAQRRRQLLREIDSG